MIVSPYDGRAKLFFDGFEFKIVIPTKKSWFLIIFCFIWLSGWSIGGIGAINSLSTEINYSINASQFFQLVIWTLSGLFTITILLWTFFGKEKIIIDKSLIIIENGLLNLKIKKKQYNFNMVKNLEFNTTRSTSVYFRQGKSIGDFMGFTGGKLKFDYGMKTIMFGSNIDEAEARYLLDEIKKKGFYKEK
jgi:hypothetical protein